MHKKIGPWVFLTAWVMLFVPRSAQAYIDPGTGSYILQTLLAILFAAGFTLKIYWRHAVGFLRVKLSRKRPDQKPREPEK